MAGSPVSRLAATVGNCEDKQQIFVGSVNIGIRKAANNKGTKFRINE
jgi:hypothetical protein